MKTYNRTKIERYWQIFHEFIVDFSMFTFLPIALLPKMSLYIVFLWLGLVAVLFSFFHYKKDREYYPFLVEIYKDKIHLRYYDDLFLRPFFMSKFVDDTIEFKNIEHLEFGRFQWHGSIYFYLKDNGYYRFTSINGKTVFKIYTDLNQALEEFRENKG